MVTSHMPKLGSVWSTATNDHVKIPLLARVATKLTNPAVSPESVVNKGTVMTSTSVEGKVGYTPHKSSSSACNASEFKSYPRY